MFGEAQPHHAYLFANRRGNRLKVLVHDGYGIWLANRRLNQGRFQLADRRWQRRAHPRAIRCPDSGFALGTAGRWRRDPGSLTVHHWGSPR
jgi:transposase